MSIKSRFLRVLLFGGLLFLFAGYFAFSTFLFSPTEGKFAADLATLMPRDADFYLRKANLRDDLVDPFPRLSEWDRIEATQAWRAYSIHDLPELESKYGISQQIASLAGLEKTMRGVNPLSVFGGKDLCVAGDFAGSDLTRAEWAVYGRVNWMGKLGVGLLRYPGLLGLDAQGLTVTRDDPYVTISGTDVGDLHLTRVRDVVIAGTSRKLVEDAVDLAARGGENSFGQSALYYDNIQTSRLERQGSAAELYVDYRLMAENLQLAGAWPNPESDVFLEAFLGRLFQVGLIKSLLGVVDFRNGLQAELHGDISSEVMTGFQKRFYGRRGFDNALFLEEAARLAKVDTSCFLYVHGNVGDLLTEMIASLEPAMRANIEDFLRSTGKYADTNQLVSEIDDLVEGRLALLVRPNDYPYEPDKDAPHDGRPTPAWALVLWTKSGERTDERINDLHQLIVMHQGNLGLRGRTDRDRGVFTNKVEGGFKIWEFWHPFVTGTGHIATVKAADFYIVSNTYQMLGEVLKTYYTGGSSYPRLSDRPDFRALVGSSLTQANVGLWLNPRTLGSIRRQFAQRAAEDSVSDGVDWNAERARIEEEVLRENYPGRQRGSLDEATQAEVNLLVNPRVDALEQELLRERVPQQRAALERGILYSEVATGVLLLLALDSRDFDLSLRAMIPLDE